MKRKIPLILKTLLPISISLSDGCQAQTEAQIKGELETETRIVARFFTQGENLYFKTLQHQPDIITTEVYKSALSTMMVLWINDKAINKDNYIETQITNKNINALCITSKLLLNETYLATDKKYREYESYQEFFQWLTRKQGIWQEILKKENYSSSIPSCLDIT